MIRIQQLTAAQASEYLESLAQVLLDCVAGGASVGFMASLSKHEAEAFFAKIVEEVERGERILLAAFRNAELIGTVQVRTGMPPNQPHRADVAKLLVHRSARGQGVATQLMKHVEEVSTLAGKSLLVLDTVTGGVGEKLYESLGWQRVGVIPRYALYPDGTWCDTTVFYKQLTSHPG